VDAQTQYDTMFDIIMGACGTQAVRTLAGLSVAEHLSDGPLSAAEIASRESADPAMTHRVLRAGGGAGPAHV
jgi:hypothetical protein